MWPFKKTFKHHYNKAGEHSERSDTSFIYSRAERIVSVGCEIHTNNILYHKVIYDNNIQDTVSSLLCYGKHLLLCLATEDCMRHAPS